MTSGYLSSIGRAIRLRDWSGPWGWERDDVKWLTGDLASLFRCPLLVHAAILAINEAVERGLVEDTLTALQNPSALLGNLREPLAAIYQELLAQAKMEKAANARNCVRRNLRMQGLDSWVV